MNTETANKQIVTLTDRLLSIFLIVLRHRKLVLKVAIPVFIGFFLYALLATKYYSSSAVILAEADQSIGSIGAMAGGSSSPLSSLSLFRGVGATLDYKLLNILRSRDLFESVNRETNLAPFLHPDGWDEQTGDWLEGEAPNMDEVYEEFTGDVFNAYYDEEMSSVRMSVVTSDPEMSYRVANEVIRQLQMLLSEKSSTTAAKTRVFLEQRISEVKGELTAAEEQLRVFQVKSRIYLPEIQFAGTLELIANLEARRLSNEVQLGILSKYASKDNSKIKVLEDEIAEIVARIDGIRTGKNGKDGPEMDKETGNLKRESTYFIPPLEEAPELLQQYVQHKREVMFYEKLHGLLLSELEYTKLKEQKDDLSFIVVDTPRVAVRKCKPRRSLIALFGLFFAPLCGTLAALGREYYPGIRRFYDGAMNQPNPQASDQ